MLVGAGLNGDSNAKTVEVFFVDSGMSLGLFCERTGQRLVVSSFFPRQEIVLRKKGWMEGQAHCSILQFQDVQRS